MVISYHGCCMICVWMANLKAVAKCKQWAKATLRSQCMNQSILETNKKRTTPRPSPRGALISLFFLGDLSLFDVFTHAQKNAESTWEAEVNQLWKRPKKTDFLLVYPSCVLVSSGSQSWNAFITVWSWNTKITAGSKPQNCTTCQQQYTTSIVPVSDML